MLIWYQLNQLFCIVHENKSHKVAPSGPTLDIYSVILAMRAIVIVGTKVH